MPKTATSRAQIPVMVQWKCSHCGCMNNQPHTLEFQASTEATLLANDEKLKEKARAKLQAALPEEIRKITSGNYQKAKLKLACSSCSQKELWAQFRELPNWVIITFIVGMILLVLDVYVLDTGFLGGIGAVAAFGPLIVMAIVNAIANKGLNKKIQVMPEESKPHFFMKN